MFIGKPTQMTCHSNPRDMHTLFNHGRWDGCVLLIIDGWLVGACRGAGSRKRLRWPIMSSVYCLGREGLLAPAIHVNASHLRFMHSRNKPSSKLLSHAVITDVDSYQKGNVQAP